MDLSIEKEKSTLPRIPLRQLDRESLLAFFRKELGADWLQIHYSLDHLRETNQFHLVDPAIRAESDFPAQNVFLSLDGRIHAEIAWDGPEITEQVWRELLWCLLESHWQTQITTPSDTDHQRYELTDLLEWLDSLGNDDQDLDPNELLRSLLDQIKRFAHAERGSLAMTRKDGQIYHWLHDGHGGRGLIESLDLRPDAQAWTWISPPLQIMICNLNLGRGPWIHCILGRTTDRPAFDRADLSLVTYLGQLYAQQLNYKQMEEDLHLSAQLMTFEREDQLRRQQKGNSLKIHTDEVDSDIAYLQDMLIEWQRIAHPKGDSRPFNMELVSIEEEIRTMQGQLRDKIQAIAKQLRQIFPDP